MFPLISVKIFTHNTISLLRTFVYCVSSVCLCECIVSMLSLYMYVACACQWHKQCRSNFSLSLSYCVCVSSWIYSLKIKLCVYWMSIRICVDSVCFVSFFFVRSFSVVCLVSDDRWKTDANQFIIFFSSVLCRGRCWTEGKKRQI